MVHMLTHVSYRVNTCVSIPCAVCDAGFLQAFGNRCHGRDYTTGLIHVGECLMLTPVSKQPYTTAVHVDAACKHVGGFSALARLLRITPSTPHMWKARGVVPAEHCAAIEQATDRAVMRWDLRPDDWWKIWPELIGKKGAPAVPKSEAV